MLCYRFGVDTTTVEQTQYFRRWSIETTWYGEEGAICFSRHVYFLGRTPLRDHPAPTTPLPLPPKG